MTKHEYTYQPPAFFRNGHIQSIFPNIFRRVTKVAYQRERIFTPDGDFIDLDWSVRDNDRLAIISHGLEGNSNRTYVRGMVKAVNQGGWDAMAWNYRSCSGETNRQLRSYHNGVTDDLSLVISHAKRLKRYSQISLIGFSLGGNLTLLYLGRETPDPIITKTVVYSVPCDLKGSAKMMKKNSNLIYMKRFLILLHQKIKAKKKKFPDRIDDTGFQKIKDFKGFDDRYTAPIHGFANAEDYWQKCSSKPHIRNIPTPTLIVNALNDPFLSDTCFPYSEAEANKNVTLCTPESGGHVGFVSFNRKNRYWSEQVAVDFLNA